MSSRYGVPEDVQEYFDSPEEVRSSAGISTNTGIRATRPEVTRIQPTKGHMAITRLYELGHLKYLISQNIDGLHVRSGILLTGGNLKFVKHTMSTLTKLRIDAIIVAVRNSEFVRNSSKSLHTFSLMRSSCCAWLVFDLIVNLQKTSLDKGYDQVRDLELDRSFNEMIILPNAT
ncbi:751_t:CDS:2, partial [Acaulospora morrowiae]